MTGYKRRLSNFLERWKSTDADDEEGSLRLYHNLGDDLLLQLVFAPTRRAMSLVKLTLKLITSSIYLTAGTPQAKHSFPSVTSHPSPVGGKPRVEF